MGGYDSLFTLMELLLEPQRLTYGCQVTYQRYDNQEKRLEVLRKSVLFSDSHEDYEKAAVQ